MWMYKNEPVQSLPEDCVGFVYLITNTISGRRYIGKKLAKFSKTSVKTVVQKNGIKKKKKIRSKIDSDWQTYWSSSPEVKADVAALGEDKFTREILYYCASKGTLSYVEMREQVLQRVLEQPDLWYNGIIQCRIHRSHVVNAPAPFTY